MGRRDLLTDEILASTASNMLFEMATGSGKTLMALKVLNKRTKIHDKVLIVVPRLVLIDEWKKEIKKWGYSRYLPNITFVTYVSFPKMAGFWNTIIFDEVHHLSERCREALTAFTFINSLLLSATVGRNLKKEIISLFKPLKIFRISTREAINDGVLPDPRVILIPLSLDRKRETYEIVKNKGKGSPIVIQYKDKWKYKSYKGEVHIKCTQGQYYDDMSSLIQWYKNKIHIPAMKNLYLHKCGERLKWLSSEKTGLVYSILLELRHQRTITFCSSIIQTEMLGKYCINSNNPNSQKHLTNFNEGKINHITCVDMLTEGANLASCKVGIFAGLNSSQRIIIQKLGRLLRHEEPVIILPYYIGTRDDEIVHKMCEDYNPELIIRLKDKTELKNYI